MTTPRTPLVAVLAAWPAGPGAAPAARCATAVWSDDPVLAAFVSPGVLAALGRRARDGWAATAALAGLVDWLAPVTARWVRAGLPRWEVEAAEADLVAACWAGLVERTGRGDETIDPASVVQAGWHRVHGTRRTERARTARQRPLAAVVDRSTPPPLPAAERVLAVLPEAVTNGVVSRSGAAAVAWQAAGWTSREVATRTGTAPAAIRARRSRAVRRLADAVQAGTLPSETLELGTVGLGTVGVGAVGR